MHWTHGSLLLYALSRVYFPKHWAPVFMMGAELRCPTKGRDFLCHTVTFPLLQEKSPLLISFNLCSLSLCTAGQFPPSAMKWLEFNGCWKRGEGDLLSPCQAKQPHNTTAIYLERHFFPPHLTFSKDVCHLSRRLQALGDQHSGWLPPHLWRLFIVVVNNTLVESFKGAKTFLS